MNIVDFLRGRTPKDDFAKRVMARLAERGWAHAMTYDPKGFSISLGGEGGAMYLHNTFRDWLTYPEAERSVALDLAIGHVLEEKAELDFEAAQDLLMPLVRNRCDMLLTQRTDQDEDGPRLALEPLAGPLCVLVAIDRPHSMSMLNETTLKTWEQPFAHVKELAIRNLESRSPCSFRRAGSGYYVSQFEDFYDASRLLLPRLFDQLELRGAPVAVAVSRSGLIVAGSDDTEGLNAMAAFVEEVMKGETRPISYAPLILDGNVWRPFEPEIPELAPLRVLAATQRLWDYAKQQRVLEDERSRREVFVATADSRFHDGELLSWATWTKGVPTLLPRTDYIAITDLKLHMFRRWEDVEAICGTFQPEESHEPARYFVDRWPDLDALRRLRTEYGAPSWGPD